MAVLSLSLLLGLVTPFSILYTNYETHHCVHVGSNDCFLLGPDSAVLFFFPVSISHQGGLYLMTSCTPIHETHVYWHQQTSWIFD